MLYGHRNIAMLYGGPRLNLIYISALPYRGKVQGRERARGRTIYSYSIGSVDLPGCRSRFLIPPPGTAHRSPTLPLIFTITAASETCSSPFTVHLADVHGMVSRLHFSGYFFVILSKICSREVKIETRWLFGGMRTR